MQYSVLLGVVLRATTSDDETYPSRILLNMGLTSGPFFRYNPSRYYCPSGQLFISSLAYPLTQLPGGEGVKDQYKKKSLFFFFNLASEWLINPSSLRFMPCVLGFCRVFRLHFCASGRNTECWFPAPPGRSPSHMSLVAGLWWSCSTVSTPLLFSSDDYH